MGQPVVVVTSGIGGTSAALCTMELLQCAGNIKEFVYMGTSGTGNSFKSRSKASGARPPLG